jgi:hypothetical protein
VERLKRLGVKSSADFASDPTVRPLAEELAEVVRQIHEQDREVQRLDVFMAEAESHLRRIKRRRAVEAGGLTRGEEEQFIRTGVELTERPWSDQSDLILLEVDEILDEMLGKPEAKQQKGLR